jgi:uncharacterized protein (DUF934 family)
MNQPNSAHDPVLVDVTGEVIPNGWQLLGDEDNASADGVHVFAFDRALSDLDGLNGHYGVRVAPGDDVRLLLPFLDRIALVEVTFPGFRDGRGYSTACILREAGYTGLLRAAGDVLRDQIFFMLRCGFDEFLVKDKDPAGAVIQAAKRFTTYYQRAADLRRPAWALRPLAQAQES